MSQAERTLDPAQLVTALDTSLQLKVPPRVDPEPVTPNTKLLVVTPPTSRLNVSTIGSVSDVGAVSVAVTAELTVKHPAHVADCASGLVTVTSRALKVARGEIVMLAVT